MYEQSPHFPRRRHEQSLHGTSDVIDDKFGPKPPTPTRRRPLSARARPRGGRRVPTSLHRPLIANARFPAAARPQPVRAPPRATPRGRFRAPHEPLHGRSLSVLAPRASTRTPHVSPRHWLTAKGPPSRPAARAEGRDLRPLRPPEPNFVLCSTRNALPSPFSPRVHARNDSRFRDLEPEIAHTLRDIPEITLGSSGVRKFL